MKRSLLWFVCVIFIGTGMALAQGIECALPAADILERAAQLCEAAGIGEFCAGAGTVRVNDSQADTEFGTVLDMTTIDSLQLQDGGLVVLKTMADLPADSQPVTLIAYGSATLKNTTQKVDLPLPTVTVKNPGLYVLNLRDQPNKNSQIVGTFDVDIELVGDGRSADNIWIHVQTPDGAAWISASIVNVEDGSIDDLAVLDSHYVHPWQRMTLETTPDCGGLILQSSSDRPARIQVNGVDMLLKEGALVAEAEAEQALQLHVLTGEVLVRAAQYSAVARQADAVSVGLGGDDGLSAVDEPRVNNQYAFSSIASAPLTLLPADSAICIAGVSDSGSESSLFNGPGEPYSAVSSLSPESTYIVTGQNTAEDGSPWWRLQDRQWVAQSEIQTAGMCVAVAEVPKPSLVVIAGTNQSVVHNFLPAGTSVWQASTSEDTLSGTCSSPPIAQCSHLVAMIPDGNGGIGWRGQEPRPYPMGAVGGDTFAFSGRNQLGNANITLSLALTGEGSWSGTMTTVYDSDPTCTHTFYYSATRVR
jgi:hypothetical protein